MKNKVQSGEYITLTAPYDRSSGEGALVGSLFGVAITSVANAASSTFATKGVFDLAKASGVVTQGQAIYWDNTNKNCTTTSTSNTLIGYATQAAASADASVRVLLK